MKVCKAPWNHIQVNAEGDLNPCCMFFPSIYKQKYDSIQDAFEGPENLELRNKMLKGEKIEGCNKCNLYDELGIEPFRNYFDHYSLEKPKIRELEYSIDNVCNFKCVTCNSRFSSKWYKDDIKLLKLGISRPESKAIKNKRAHTSFNGDIKNVDLSELQTLKILGGEPFINVKYLEMLQNIDLTKVTLAITTNNSIFPRKWIDTLLKCKRVRLMISIDGIDEVGEFVRYGMKQKRFTKNLHLWKEVSAHNTNIEISFNYVFNILNCFNLNKTLEYTGAENFIVDLLTGPDYLNVQYLPDSLKEDIVPNINKFKDYGNIIDFMNNGSYKELIMLDFANYCHFLEERLPLPEECEIIYNGIVKELYK